MKTRNHRGGGTLRERAPYKDGTRRFELRYVDGNGDRQSAYVAGTKTDAARKLRELTGESDNGLTLDRTTTFGEYADVWIGLVGAGLRPRSLRDYEYTIDHYLRPKLGRRRLADINEADVSQLVDGWIAAGAAPGAIRKRVGFLRMILGRAHAAGRVKRNVARLVDIPTYERAPIHPPTADDVRRIMRAVAGTPDEAAYALAIGTGMRQGELLALRWRDVDLDARIARLTASIAYGSATRGRMKTRASTRAVPLAPFVVDVLRQVGPGDPDAFISATRTGRPLHARNLLRRFRATTVELGLPAYRWHDFRHYAATAMIAGGVPLATVAAILGHSSITTTVDTYGHLRSDGAAAALALDIDLSA